MKNKIKYWRFFIYIICGLMLIAPYSETFNPIDKNGEWLKNYAFNSIEYAIVIIPMIILLVAIPRLENKISKRISIGVLGLLSTLGFLYAFLSVSMPVQDFIPLWGMLIFFVLFPIVIVNAFLERTKETENLQELN